MGKISCSAQRCHVRELSGVPKSKTHHIERICFFILVAQGVSHKFFRSPRLRASARCLFEILKTNRGKRRPHSALPPSLNPNKFIRHTFPVYETLICIVLFCASARFLICRLRMPFLKAALTDSGSAFSGSLKERLKERILRSRKR